MISTTIIYNKINLLIYYSISFILFVSLGFSLNKQDISSLIDLKAKLLTSLTNVDHDNFIPVENVKNGKIRKNIMFSGNLIVNLILK